MSNKDTARERVASMLEAAASHVDPVDVRSSHPQHGLVQAASLASDAWRDAQVFIYPPDKKPLRIAVVALRAMAEVTSKSYSLQKSDADMLTSSAATLRRVAQNILRDPRVERVARMGISVTGARYRDDSEMTRHPSVLVGSDLHAASDDAMERVEDASRMRGRLPVSVPTGQPYVKVSMPILVYPVNPVSQAALDRAGVPGFVVRDSGGSGRAAGLAPAPGKGSSLMLERQLVVGLRRPESNAKMIESVVADVSRRMGPHVCPMPDQRTIASPGSHLDWLWLVPRAVMNSRAFVVRSASFPWQSDHNPESHRLARRDESNLIKELRELDAAQELLLRRGQSLDDAHLLRQSELREALHRSEGVGAQSEVEDRLTKNARDRAEAERLAAKKSSLKLARLQDLQEQLQELGAPRDGERPIIKSARVDVTRAINRLKKEIQAERDDAMATMRRRPGA